MGEPASSHEFAKNLVKLTFAGGIAFWLGTITMSLTPIAADYRAALSLSYFQTVFVEALVAGMIIACCVSFTLLRFGGKLPTRSPILKSELLSLIALALLFIPVQVAASRSGSGDAFRIFLIGAALNVPRFFVLGLAIGYFYRRATERAIRTSVSASSS